MSGVRKGVQARLKEKVPPLHLRALLQPQSGLVPAGIGPYCISHF